MSRKVLIFTKRVLPKSNTFVASQSNNLKRYQPIHIGLRTDASGIDLLKATQHSIQANHTALPSVSRFLLDGAQRVNSQWRNELSKLDGAIIHAQFGKGGHYCVPIASALGIPLVTTFHGSDVTQRDKFSYRTAHRVNVFTHSEKIVAVSKFIEEKLVEAGCPADKLIQHYVGVDNHYFLPTVEKATNPTVLFVGRLIEQKGCQYLLQAMKLVNKKLPEAKLVVAGYGSYSNKLEAMSQGQNSVTFLGPQNQDQVLNLMSQAWITCVPSIKMARGNEEAMSMVCLESQATGTPVVAFDTGGISEGVADGITGLLSPEKEIDTLADNLYTLLSSKSKLDQMGKAGIKRVDDHFNIRKQCMLLESIYDKAINL